MDSSNSITVLIQQARAGSDAAIGELITAVRTYLLLVANQETDVRLKEKLAASDIVQDACLKAHQRFDSFRGTTEAELRAWMRKVLLNSLSDSRRKFVQAKKRDVSREVVPTDQIGLPSAELTPKSAAIAQEEANLLRSAMERLSETHRRVLHLRNWELLPFDEIGEQMSRSPDAAQKLWSRALRELEKELRT